MRIYKYSLEITDEQIIPVQSFEKVLSVIEMNDRLYLYCVVNEFLSNITDVKVYIKGTGHSLDDIYGKELQFMGTFPTYNGKLVWHVFVGDKL